MPHAAPGANAPQRVGPRPHTHTGKVNTPLSFMTELLQAFASAYLGPVHQHSAEPRERFPQAVCPSLWRTPPLRAQTATAVAAPASERVAA